MSQAIDQSAKARILRQLCINPRCRREFLTLRSRKVWCTAGCREEYHKQLREEARLARLAAKGAA